MRYLESIYEHGTIQHSDGIMHDGNSIFVSDVKNACLRNTEYIAWAQDDTPELAYYFYFIFTSYAIIITHWHVQQPVKSTASILIVPPDGIEVAALPAFFAHDPRMSSISLTCVLSPLPLDSTFCHSQRTCLCNCVLAILTKLLSH